jgi:hypothetical protein
VTEPTWCSSLTEEAPAGVPAKPTADARQKTLSSIVITAGPLWRSGDLCD